jgi:hypothetical protein
MSKKLKSISWLPVIGVAILSWYLINNMSLPTFIMDFIRSTGPLELILFFFLYSWILFAIFFFKGKTIEKVSIHAFVSTILGVAVYYLYQFIQPILEKIF